MNHFKTNFYDFKSLSLQLDISKMGITEDFIAGLMPKMEKAFQGIADIEAGKIMNSDENRMVGHYWLRSPEKAPTPEISKEISDTIAKIKTFAKKVHEGAVKSPSGKPFTKLLLIGIGGSSLGPQFVSKALETNQDKMKLFFVDNTDPDGMDFVFEKLKADLPQTLTVVISKSGGTIETRNGMEEARKYYGENGLDFAKHAVAITGEGSLLYNTQRNEGWLEFFPMWDFVGGRTSVISAVGLLPFALQGLDIDGLIAGCAACDELTLQKEIKKNPAALLALAWYRACGEKSGVQMVMLPYKDRLELFSKYLQQLIMESIGKTLDLDGNVVHQGIAVLGNKGATDQHSYVQQLLEGPDNFFVTFIEVLRDRKGTSPLVLENSTAGDYLSAFYLGTRKAMESKGRNTITITIESVNAFSIGVLIALYERAVSLYALLVHINAYHQPAVESGKKAAGEVITLKNRALTLLQEGGGYTVEALAQKLEADSETVFKIMQHLAANTDHGVLVEKAEDIFENQFFMTK